MRRLFGASAEALIIVILVFGLMAMPVLAARGGGQGGAGKPGGGDSGGTISMVVMDSTDGLAHYGQRVTFNVSTTATDSPYVQLLCSQGGTLVFEGYQGFFTNAIGNEWFHLGPTPLWESGEADCTANLVKYTRKGWQQLAFTGFHVEP